MRLMHSVIVAVAATALAACATADSADDGASETASDIDIKPRQAWQLDVGNNVGGNVRITVEHDGVFEPTCHDQSCSYGFVDGTVVHVTTSQEDTINCELFSNWVGACAGQGRACTLVMHANVTSTAIYGFKRGCTPR